MVNCQMNQIFLGEVAAVQNYGAFIRIPGCSQQGLIHKSQVSSSYVDNVTEVLQKGERVWCKVISMSDDGKIGLSMKHVHQGNGKDLDPNGVELQKDIQKKKTIVPQQRKTIQLEAVFNTTCTKCGTKGHLAKDCFVPPNGKKYELIPEIEEDIPVSKSQTEEEDKKEDEKEEQKVNKKHKVKKIKKRKKSKKSRQHTDESGSSEEEKTRKRKKKRSKDHKHKKKRHNSTSTSDTDSSNSANQEVKSHKRKYSEDTSNRAKKHKHSKAKHTD